MKQIKYLYNQDFLLIILLQSTSPWWKSSQLFNWSKVQQVRYWLHHIELCHWSERPSVKVKTEKKQCLT